MRRIKQLAQTNQHNGDLLEILLHGAQGYPSIPAVRNAIASRGDAQKRLQLVFVFSFESRPPLWIERDDKLSQLLKVNIVQATELLRDIPLNRCSGPDSTVVGYEFLDRHLDVARDKDAEVAGVVGEKFRRHWLPVEKIERRLEPLTAAVDLRRSAQLQLTDLNASVASRRRASTDSSAAVELVVAATKSRPLTSS